MNGFIVIRIAVVFSFLILGVQSYASMPTNPVADHEFMKLPNGKTLSSISVNGAPLSLSRGTGMAFTATAKAAYLKLKNASQTIAGYPVQWVLMDLDSHQVLDQSADADQKIFGASVAKVFTAATLLDKQNGNLSSSQLQLMANMLVVSSNVAWTNLQGQIGGGNQDQGRATIQNFTQRMGYLKTRGFQGFLGNMHGNELTAAELAEFMHDMYKGEFPGAEVQWKLMHTCRTGATRARRYLPTNIYVGAKTGTYDGPSVNPETGTTLSSNGSAYSVKVRNQVVVFNVNGREYALAILANTGSDDSAALLAGGLFRQITGALR